ncbi:hypothetical protein ACFQZQ_03965 [Lysobacter koreensis]|uniref:Uncharacterized protein n=1 Tax=Lysobacter koreensis TaxID=266122 RepID=A0ABW2YJR8_9GAMM
MTTSTQQTVLTEQEIACLRAIDQGQSQPADDPMLAALAAKGMVDLSHGSAVLTPAGRHATHVGEPGRVPGIDT